MADTIPSIKNAHTVKNLNILAIPLELFNKIVGYRDTSSPSSVYVTLRRL
jgi:hypothetical protein